MPPRDGRSRHFGAQIVDANQYMTLGTADASGRPWVSPVWYAPEGYAAFLQVSRAGTRHSLNLSERPAVYMSGSPEELTGRALERGIDLFSRRSLAAKGGASVGGERRDRQRRAALSRAGISECFFGASDRRKPVSEAYLTGP